MADFTPRTDNVYLQELVEDFGNRAVMADTALKKQELESIEGYLSELVRYRRAFRLLEEIEPFKTWVTFSVQIDKSRLEGSERDKLEIADLIGREVIRMMFEQKNRKELKTDGRS